ncbi:pyridoxamine 5'-phosphate oxidase family protein [Streptomyces sp. NBC_01304]|uniref:pyridoxamine 5'-phosphate oxidase family protein n=1 Tax=Streptomyces sp. NBC_01304 TaxID=2903818 RepID=UPI002E15F068|nr:pyridoxamine 5'-phosphate oxidase family protein [Streptomyces sp. NBC_01304]
MTSRYAQIAFTSQVRGHQAEHGSVRGYDRMAASGPREADRLGEDEEWFIGERDSFYLASISETGWPYVQHRGGPKGFLRPLDGGRALAFADFRGNKQYITTGNLDHDDRVALFLIDYPRRARLKIYGRARTVRAEDEPQLLTAVRDAEYRAVVERVMVIDVEAYDWNCSQHLTPRFSEDEVQEAVRPLRARLDELERENAELRATGRGVRAP